MFTRDVKVDSTSISIYLRFLDSTTGAPVTTLTFATAGLSLQYRRQGAAVTTITPVTLASASAVWTSGGFIHLMHGWYRLDVPNAAFATGATGVLISGSGTGIQSPGAHVQIRAVDFNDTVRMGLTALPNVALGSAGGLLATGTGANQLNVTSGRADANVTHVEGQEVSSTTYTAVSVSGTTVVLPSGASTENDVYNGWELHVLSSATGLLQTVKVLDYVGSTRSLTVSPWPLSAPTGTVIVDLTPGVPVTALSAQTATSLLSSVLTPTVASGTNNPTVEQLLMMIGASLGIFRMVVSGTTITVYAPDKTTVLMTWTTNSATAPTERTRAT
jgi:hypothetical protein